MRTLRQLWSPRDSRKFIQSEFPWFLNTYDNYVIPIQRLDALRYFLMRHFGGIYIDLDNVSRPDFAKSIRVISTLLCFSPMTLP